MKLSQFGSILLAGAAYVYASGNAAVFELKDGNHHHENVVVGLHESTLYFADKFGVDEYYSLGRGNESFNLVKNLHSADSEKQNVLFIVKGVDSPSTLFLNAAADIEQESASSGELSFEINLPRDNDAHTLVKRLFRKLPRQFAHVVNATEVTKVTDEIRMVAAQESESKSMKHSFKRLQDELPRHWQSFFENEAQNTMDLLTSSLNVLNDKLFISEILQVSKIAKQGSQGLIVANLDSLLSLGTKIGYDSATYQIAKKTLVRAIQAMRQNFDVTVVAFGPEHKSACNGSRMMKRSKELADVFAVFSKRGAVAAKSCFSDEEACVSATNSCSGHGACSKVQSNCWQCACKPTYDKKQSKTTIWAGYDCSKKNIAAQANLLLWTSVALLLTLVGGVKLLFSIDSQPLPGVLEAATVKRST